MASGPPLHCTQHTLLHKTAAHIREGPFIRHVGRLRTLATCSGARTRRAPGACDGGRPRTMTSRPPPPFAKLPSRRRRRRVRRGCWQRAIQTRAGLCSHHQRSRRRDVTHETSLAVPVLRCRRRRHNHQPCVGVGGPRRRERGAPFQRRSYSGIFSSCN